MSTPGTGKKSLTWSLVGTALTCCAGSSLQFGYNLAVINAPELIVQDFFRDVKYFKSFIWPFAVAVFAVGGMVGAFVGPYLANLYGRKMSLVFNNATAIVGGIMLLSSKFAHSPALLVLGRVVLGINAGINTVVAPMYVTEVAPVQLRGSFGTLGQFGIVCGILLSNILGLGQVLGTKSGWPFLFGFPVLVACLQLVALPFCPESPRYLLVILQDEHKAKLELQHLRQNEDVVSELDEMKAQENSRRSAGEVVSILNLLRGRQYRRPLIISLVMQLAQQLSGIGGIFYYSTSLFVEVGLPEKHSQGATCGVGVLSVVMTGIVVFLVEYMGRKPLMLIGLAGMAVFYVVTTISLVFVERDKDWAKYVAVVATLVVIVFFQLGPGAIPWFIVAELFTQRSISSAISLAGPCNWLANFAVGLLFPVINRSIKPYTFLPFLLVVSLCWLFIFFIVPETKGLTVDEISERMQDGLVGDHAESKDEGDEINETRRLLSSATSRS